jgi:hypothetical protein
MRATFQNTGMVLSIGLFFSLMIIGLAGSLPASMQNGLVSNGVPVTQAHEIANTPPVGSLFAAFLGYNPMEKLVPADTLHALPSHQAAEITGKTFFPQLISDPFMSGLRIAFTASMIMCLIAAAASWMRGKHQRASDDDDVLRERAEAGAPAEEWVPA